MYVFQEPEDEEIESDVDPEVVRAKEFAKVVKKEKKGKRPKVEGATGGKDDFESRYNLDDYDHEENDCKWNY